MRATLFFPCIIIELGGQASRVDFSQGTFILVKESLDFSYFSVILSQNKKIENHSSKARSSDKLMTMSP